MHCHRFVRPPLSRRDMLLRCGSGFGALAAAALFREAAFGAIVGDAPGDPGSLAGRPNKNPLVARPPQFPAKARSVIFLFMDGGPSQVDTFDPKPRLDKEHGEPIKTKVEPTQFNNIGK